MRLTDRTQSQTGWALKFLGGGDVRGVRRKRQMGTLKQIRGGKKGGKPVVGTSDTASRVSQKRAENKRTEAERQGGGTLKKR